MQVRTFQPDIVRPMRSAAAQAGRRVYGTWLLAVAMILVMLAGIASGTAGYRAMIDSYGLRSESWSWLDFPAYGHLLSYAFLHGGAGHFFWNMLLLLMVGCVIEWRAGSKALIGLFVLGAVVSGLTHVLVFPVETRALIGASGAVAALFGAASVLAGDLGLRVRIPLTSVWFAVTLRRLLLVWLALQFVGMLPLIGPGQQQLSVAYWTHISGYFTGLAGAYLLSVTGVLRRGSPPRGDFASSLAAAGD